jgi:hypothetical protein
MGIGALRTVRVLFSAFYPFELAIADVWLSPKDVHSLEREGGRSVLK